MTNLTTTPTPSILSRLKKKETSFRKRQIVRISGSRYRLFQECARKWAYAEFLYRPVLDRKSKSFILLVGDAMHSAWQMYLRTRSLDAAYATLTLCWPHQHPYPKKNRPFWRAMDALTEACNHPYSQYDLVFVEKDGELQPAIELAICLIVKTDFLEIHYTGYIDAVVVDPISGLPMVLDLKSTGYRLDEWRRKYVYDTQVPGYSIIVSGISHSGKLGHNVKGAYLGTYMSGTGDAWTEALEVECGRNEALLFVHDLQMFASQVAMMQNAGRFPRSANSCQSYGSACQFLGSLCECETLTQAQREVDGLMMTEDAVMSEFVPDFTIEYTPELLK